MLLESRARREYHELPEIIQERISDALDDLANLPRPPGSKKLSGIDGYRIRKGDYRILYTIDDKAKEVKVYKLGHRREIYR